MFLLREFTCENFKRNHINDKNWTARERIKKGATVVDVDFLVMRKIIYNISTENNNIYINFYIMYNFIKKVLLFISLLTFYVYLKII